MEPTDCGAVGLAGYFDVRRIIGQARRAGIALRADGERLLLGAASTEIPVDLQARLLARGEDIRAALDRPSFTRLHRTATWLRLPCYWRDFWLETEANPALANATHGTVTLEGAVTTQGLCTTLHMLAQRHEILTARAALVDGHPCIHYDGQTRCPIEIEDVSMDAAPVRQERLAQALERTIWRRLENGQLFRACIIKLAAARFVVAFVLHHFVSDFFACQIVASDIVDLLRRQRRRTTVALAQPLQYYDYHVAMNEWTAGSGARYRLGYWERQMEGALAVRLPPDTEDRSGSTVALDSISFSIDQDLRSRLAQVAAAAGVTVAMVVLAGNFAALALILQRTDLRVVFIATGRDDPSLLRMVGATVNCFPVRVRAAADMSLAELIGRVSETYATARDYQLPWSLLMQTLRVQNVSDVAPTFNYMPQRTAAQAAPEGVEGVLVKGPDETGTTDWKSHELNIVDQGTSMSAVLKYASTRYRRHTMERLTQVLLTCLRHIATDPGTRIRDIRL